MLFGGELRFLDLSKAGKNTCSKLLLLLLRPTGEIGVGFDVKGHMQWWGGDLHSADLGL